MNKKLGVVLGVLAVLAIVVGLGVSLPVSDLVQGAKGDKGDKGDVGTRGPQGLQGLRGLQGPKGDPGTPGLGALSSPDLPSGWLSLGGGAAIEGAWASLPTGTNTIFAARPSDNGIYGTSTLVDAICRFDATTTEGAIISFYKITSAYSSGFATSGASTEVELASTTIDFKGGDGKVGTTTISLMSATTTILNDPDGSNFDPAQKEAFKNHWDPGTDRLLVRIDAKNWDKAETSGTNIVGACGGFWRTIR